MSEENKPITKPTECDYELIDHGRTIYITTDDSPQCGVADLYHLTDETREVFRKPKCIEHGTYLTHAGNNYPHLIEALKDARTTLALVANEVANSKQIHEAREKVLTALIFAREV